jgi:hypothetical protein
VISGCASARIHGTRNTEHGLNNSDLATVLVALGCPKEKSAEMASQLDKRARQLAEQKNRSYDEALEHLLKLMAQGWAAKEKGL